MENMHKEDQDAETLREENRRLMEQLDKEFPGVLITSETVAGKIMFLKTNEPYSTVMFTEHGQFMVTSVDRAPRPYDGFNVLPLLDLVKQHPESDTQFWPTADNTPGTDPLRNSNSVLLYTLPTEYDKGRGEYFYVKALELSENPDARYKLHMSLLNAQLDVVSRRLSKVGTLTFDSGKMTANQVAEELTQHSKK